jgi:hypothetical protein
MCSGSTQATTSFTPSSFFGFFFVVVVVNVSAMLARAAVADVNIAPHGDNWRPKLAALLTSTTNTKTGLVLGLLYQGVELFFEFVLYGVLTLVVGDKTTAYFSRLAPSIGVAVSGKTFAYTCVGFLQHRSNGWFASASASASAPALYLCLELRRRCTSCYCCWRRCFRQREF